MPPPAELLVVDAANVVGSRPDGWWRDRAGAARALVGRLRVATGSGRLPAPVVAVLEGAGRAGAAEGEADGVRVAHAAGSGDDTVVDLVVASGGRALVVSADRGLRHRVVAAGGRVAGPGWLLARLDQGAPPDPGGRPSAG